MARFKPKKIIELYKSILPAGELFPTNTDFDFWDEVYEAASAEYDREFARRYKNFLYFDFLEAETTSDALTNFKADVLSILTFNKKRYEEMYRVFCVTDDEDPFTYDYEMVETTGAQHTETEYGATSQTKGQETFTKGQETFTKGAETFTKGSQTLTKGAETFTKGSQSNTIGGTTNTHAVAPYNVQTLTPESSDTITAQSNTEGQREDTNSQRIDTEGQREDTEGQRQDTEGQRIDTNAARTDTALAHTDQTDSDEWTLTKRGSTLTAADNLRLHTQYWTEQYKFMQLIFDDIAAQLLLIGED